MPTAIGYAHHTPVKRPEWHSLIAWDMLFNNLTTGLFLAACLCELASPEVFRGVARWAYRVALMVLIADLICLVLDLGDPLRFHHMLRMFKPSSPMSLGTWCLTVYSLPLTLVVAIDLLPPRWRWLGGVRWAALTGGLLPALGSAAYKGVLLSTSSQPGWKEARWLGGYLANAALMIGCAGMLTLAVILGEGRAADRLRPGLAVLVAIHLVPAVLLAIDVHKAFAALYGRNRLIGLAAAAITGGALIPLSLLIATKDGIATLLAVASILLTSLLIRFLLVKLPHSTP